MVYFTGNVSHLLHRLGTTRNALEQELSEKRLFNSDHCIGFPSTSTRKLLFAVDEMESRRTRPLYGYSKVNTRLINPTSLYKKEVAASFVR
jgi:hypothetical protein